MQTSKFIRVDEVAEELNVSKPYAYKLIRQLNDELSTQFLLINGYMSVAQSFMKEMENVSYQVAAGKINKDLLHEIMDSILKGHFETDEVLKLKIINAIM